MNIIIINDKKASAKSLRLTRFAKLCLVATFFTIPAATAYLGYKSSTYFGQTIFNAQTAELWASDLNSQKDDIDKAKTQLNEHLSALTLRISQLQARITRLDALGERITDIANLDGGEFDFSNIPAMGGPVTPQQNAQEYEVDYFLEHLGQLSVQVEDREQQLEVLEALLGKQKLQKDVFIAGRPVVKGWMSSRYGQRVDPITGKLSWHQGVDFAGKEDSEIISVAAGVVTRAEMAPGYGLLVELNHGGGYMTKYGHNKELKVKVGDVVNKNQVISLMGSTGRSTGPHVHFEVYKNSRAVNPASFIQRASY